MFGITYQPVQDAKVWHPDVEVYDILRRRHAVLGRIYLDMYPRDNKYKHYAQFTLANGKEGSRCRRACWCATSRAAATEPALMEHSRRQDLLPRVRPPAAPRARRPYAWAGICGVATEQDFVEAPSQMLEEWVLGPEDAADLCEALPDDEPIPARLVQQHESGRRVRQGTGRSAADVLRGDKPRPAQPRSREARHDRGWSRSCRRSTRRSSS